MQKKIVVMNFSNVYEEENFYKNAGAEWIDCSDISGADCFCDDEAAAEIRRRLQDVSAHGLHFIDSGNYHYVSRFFTDKIKERFVLVVFDHHPDMQPPLFEQILTCGDWVKSVIDTNKNLEKVVLVGTSDKLIANIPEEYATVWCASPSRNCTTDRLGSRSTTCTSSCQSMCRWTRMCFLQPMTRPTGTKASPRYPN